jgi:hypothetical protein
MTGEKLSADEADEADGQMDGNEISLIRSIR